jgi:hypothetical protein
MSETKKEKHNVRSTSMEGNALSSWNVENRKNHLTELSTPFLQVSPVTILQQKGAPQTPEQAD